MKSEQISQFRDLLEDKYIVLMPFQVIPHSTPRPNVAIPFIDHLNH